MKRLSEREQQVLAFIRDHIALHGRSPYQHEIMGHLGGSSLAFTQRLLKSMVSKGAIVTIPCVPGSITLCDAAPRSPIQVELRNDVRNALELISKAEGADAATIIAEWVSERVSHELRSKSRAA